MPGILDAMSIASAHGGGTANFAVGSTASGPLKVFNCVWTPRVEGEAVPKLNAGGSWPANTEIRALVIDADGMIVGSSPSDYWTQRAALIAAVVPPSSRTRTTRHHGTL